MPIGSRVPTKNPNRFEVDPQPEPDHATWAKVSITVERSDGGIVDAQIIRPRSWILESGLCAGRMLPLNLPELEVSGLALVTAIDDCPPIAGGEGSVVTARFVTREVHVVASVDVLGADGTVETITGTTIHPVWSVDRQEWVPLAELAEGETLQGLDGLAVVLSVSLSRVSQAVYNIEVHGEHVYQVGELGLVVHNVKGGLSAPVGTSYSMKAVRERWWGGKAPVRLNPHMPRGREYMELSHTYISQNGAIGKLIPDWIKNRGWNLKPMWGSEHALVDPLRYQFMTRAWKATNEIYSPWMRMLGRMPTSHKVGAGGVVVGGAGYVFYDYFDQDE